MTWTRRITRESKMSKETHYQNDQNFWNDQIKMTDRNDTTGQEIIHLLNNVIFSRFYDFAKFYTHYVNL